MMGRSVVACTVEATSAPTIAAVFMRDIFGSLSKKSSEIRARALRDLMLHHHLHFSISKVSLCLSEVARWFVMFKNKEAYIFVFCFSLVMASCAEASTSPSKCYTIPPELSAYDFTKSTESNYKISKNDKVEFVGQFVEHRKSLDYNYHVHYNPQRQLLQDKVIRHFLRTFVKDSKTNKYCSRPTAPWVINALCFSRLPIGKKRIKRIKTFPLVTFTCFPPHCLRCCEYTCRLFLQRALWELGKVMR
jgi:hypothetical protein